jgi:hypothetical protein
MSPLTFNWKLQLNCICNHLAKQCISELEQLRPKTNSLFPLEPIGVFIKGEKLSSDTCHHIRFHTQCQLAKKLFMWKKILSCDGFHKVGWDSFHTTLHSVPRSFQVWASKHGLGIAHTMKFLLHQDNHKPFCPSCLS